jgi:HSP20 family protein
MNLIRYQSPELYNPLSFDRVATLRNELGRLFDSTPSPEVAWSPALDVHADKDRYFVSLEVPGMKKEDIQISLHEGVLTVSGERKDEREHKEGDTFRSERYFGKFERSVKLLTAIDESKVTATYKDGILTIELPKAEEAKPKQISVSVS